MKRLKDGQFQLIAYTCINEGMNLTHSHLVDDEIDSDGVETMVIDLENTCLIDENSSSSENLIDDYTYQQRTRHGNDTV
jgi:predicted HAD superfamily phosphohydrolase YqeG